MRGASRRIKSQEPSRGRVDRPSGPGWCCCAQGMETKHAHVPGEGSSRGSSRRVSRREEREGIRDCWARRSRRDPDPAEAVAYAGSPGSPIDRDRARVGTGGNPQVPALSVLHGGSQVERLSGPGRPDRPERASSPTERSWAQAPDLKILGRQPGLGRSGAAFREAPPRRRPRKSA